MKAQKQAVAGHGQYPWQSETQPSPQGEPMGTGYFQWIKGEEITAELSEDKFAQREYMEVILDVGLPQHEVHLQKQGQRTDQGKQGTEESRPVLMHMSGSYHVDPADQQEEPKDANGYE